MLTHSTKGCQSTQFKPRKSSHDFFQSRLKKLVENTKAGIMYGEWNYNGRLLTE